MGSSFGHLGLGLRVSCRACQSSSVGLKLSAVFESVHSGCLGFKMSSFNNLQAKSKSGHDTLEDWNPSTTQPVRASDNRAAAPEVSPIYRTFCAVPDASLKKTLITLSTCAQKGRNRIEK